MYTTVARIIIFALVLSCVTTGAYAVDYKEYKYTRNQAEFFEISYDREELQVTVFESGIPSTKTFAKDAVKTTNGTVIAGGEQLFDENGLIFDGRTYRYDEISDIRISDNETTVTITFLTKKTDESRPERFKKGNLISPAGNITVEEDDFIRGIVLSITGDIEVYGEVNRDIVALFGNVYIGPGAVVRGNVASTAGRIDVAGDASVYGETYYVDRKGLKRQHRFAREQKRFVIPLVLKYNRVDGLASYLGVEYRDPDSLLPTVKVTGGYGFNSERWRYDFGVEQTLLRSPAIAVGGALYRRLASDDDWLLSDNENSAFALLAREDFKDYYEAEGGTIYLRIKPLEKVTFESRYRYEETGWLDARRHLWSLFGGDKLFRENFSTVEEPFRTAGIAEIDSTTNGYLYNRIDWDTRMEDTPFDESAWHITADLEWANSSFNSDFDYRRYTVAVRRYQKINRRAMLVTRAMYGGSDGYLPMYKRFYLGGLGTLYGFEHKEYMGTRFWMTNFEYRFKFPRVETAVSVFWDAAQIANDTKLNGDIEVKHDLGLAVYFEDDFRISLAKRLDRSYDDDPKFYVRFEHVF